MIVGVTGRKKSGKDAVGATFTGFGYTPYKVATPLKNAAKALFGWTDIEIEDPIIKEIVDERYGISPRAAMQYLGHEFLWDLGSWARKGYNMDFDEKSGYNLHVMRLEEFIIANGAWKGNVVITDIRFPAEVDLIHKYRGKVIRLQRPSILDNMTSLHASEAHYDSLSVDDEILNDSTLEVLAEKAAMLASRYLTDYSWLDT